MSGHVEDLLALEAAGALAPDEAARVAAHLAECASCASESAEWRILVAGLRELPPARPSPGLVARTWEAVEGRRAEREEQSWNRAALAFLILFGWTLSGVAWFLLQLIAGELAVRLARPLGSTAAWFAGYLVAGWMVAAAAAVLLGRGAHEEGRVA